MPNNKRNIVVIGETGAGKSSLINMLVGRKVAWTSDKAVGCTFTYTCYRDNFGNCYFDTVGLNEPSAGTVSAREAIKSLSNLLKDSSDGVNLIVFVIRKGRITETMVKNYIIFVSGICDGEVPVLLAISRCEMDNDPNEWYNENKVYFLRSQMNFDEVVSGCFDLSLEKIRPSMHAAIQESYEETKKRMIQVMASGRFKTKHSFGSWVSWLKRVITKIWNIVAGWFNWRQVSLYDNLKNALMNSLDMSSAEATAIANDIMSQL